MKATDHALQKHDNLIRLQQTIWRAITGDQHNGTGNGQGTGGGNQDGKG